MVPYWRHLRHDGATWLGWQGAEHPGQRRARRRARHTPSSRGRGRNVAPGVPLGSPRRRRADADTRGSSGAGRWSGRRAGAAAESREGGSLRSRLPVIVVDASVLVTALADDGSDGDRARDRLRGERLVAPHVIDLEVTSAWRRLTAAGDLDDRRAQLALEDLRSLRVDRVPHGPLIARCWELRRNLTVYDAAYVALAEIVDRVLVTADARLAGASGSRCEIELIA